MRGLMTLMALAAIVVACTGTTERQEVADEIAHALAESFLQPLQELAHGGTNSGDDTSEILDKLVDQTLDELPPPPGVRRLMEGRGVGIHQEADTAWATTTVVVVPSSDPSEPYCVAVGVHSDGRVEATHSSGEPLDPCSGANYIDFDRQ
ncbi:MAG: hypothetical protein ACLFRT_10965 [Actinomycetota bacterium]